MNTELEQTDVFLAGADDVHTYRIPSLLVAPDGTLLAFCEARKISGADASPTDMVLKRSVDNGNTWLPMQRILCGIDDEAIMNPCPVVDGDEVLLICMNAHKTKHGHHRQLLMRSRDNGATWTEPCDLTDSIVNGDSAFIPGPGVSIRMRSGRLVIPGYTNAYDEDGNRLDSRSRALFSDDSGKSWQLGGPVSCEFSNESQVVELSDGALVLNCRVQKGHPDHPGCRSLAISRNGGESWEESFLKPELNEMPCQAGFISYEHQGRTRLVFSNPDARLDLDGSSRTRMTVKVSDDEGATWPWQRLVRPEFSIYSSPALLPDGQIGLLYEWANVRHAVHGIRLAKLALPDTV